MADRTKLILAADAALLALLIAAPAVACLWDRDTLKAEADGLPGVVDAIVGRFPRPPALYYEMRLERVTGELETDPTRLALYDDAAVACDRLGRSDEAIEWMARKRAQLDQLDSFSAEVIEHEYRYLANLGTFHAHRWFADGANRDDLTDMKRARELIAAAIDLNPDAHFGREKYQLHAIEYVLQPPPLIDDWSLPSMARDSLGDAITGLVGLITLGDAWRSFDIHHALGQSLSAAGHASLARIARLRCEELVRDGARSIHPGLETDEAHFRALQMIGMGADDREAIDAYFTEARRHADEWRNARREFMLAKLNAGDHPDTNADFWAGFREPAAPKLPNGVLGMTPNWWATNGTVAMILGLLAAMIAAIIGVRIWRRRRRNRRIAIA